MGYCGGKEWEINGRGIGIVGMSDGERKDDDVEGLGKERKKVGRSEWKKGEDREG